MIRAHRGFPDGHLDGTRLAHGVLRGQREWPRARRSIEVTQQVGTAGQACILVVDDEWLIRWSFSQVLGLAGYRVLEAQDASEALRHLDGPSGFDAVLLDLKLPDQDGLSVLRRIKAARPSCPVIMMTAHGSADDAREALAAGAFRFVMKPLEQQDMLDLLGQALAPTA